MTRVERPLSVVHPDKRTLRLIYLPIKLDEPEDVRTGNTSMFDVIVHSMGVRADGDGVGVRRLKFIVMDQTMYVFSPKVDHYRAFRILRSLELDSKLYCAGDICVDFGDLVYASTAQSRVVRGWSEVLQNEVLLSRLRSDNFKSEVLAKKLPADQFRVE